MRPTPRKHLLPAEVATLLRTAADQIRIAEATLREDPQNRVRMEGLFVAEQTRLLVRLAADTAARRGELATLRLSDLDGRVLTIERNLSLDVLGPTKTSRTRRMTIGAERDRYVGARLQGLAFGERPSHTESERRQRAIARGTETGRGGTSPEVLGVRPRVLRSARPSTSSRSGWSP
jgi:integrase